MEGRWSIDFWCNRPVVHGAPPAADGAVPVVPCDDAAIRRVAETLSYYLHNRSSEYVQAAAEAALRAAGETP